MHWITGWSSYFQ